VVCNYSGIWNNCRNAALCQLVLIQLHHWFKGPNFHNNSNRVFVTHELCVGVLSVTLFVFDSTAYYVCHYITGVSVCDCSCEEQNV
jgi:hypothetical protein